VKDFDEAWSDGTAARLASLQSGLSTRLGAALRHATRALTAQPASRRLVVVMSDGEPHDVDIHDPHYLIEDARHAVQSARLVGIGTLGLLLDAEGAAASRRIFGAGQSALLGDAASLPSVLGRLLG
jgi:nitric oxide reductase NorD protein